jgi:hypothetical protein
MLNTTLATALGIDTEESIIATCCDEVKEPDVIDLYLQDFQSDPDKFFDEYGKKSPELISSFMNTELIDSDPECFVFLYNLLLRKVCFDCDKDVALKSLSQLIQGNNQEEREAITIFLENRGLLEETYKRFKIIGLLPVVSNG